MERGERQAARAAARAAAAEAKARERAEAKSRRAVAKSGTFADATDAVGETGRAEAFAEPAPDLLERTVSRRRTRSTTATTETSPPWEVAEPEEASVPPPEEEREEEIPIHALEDYQPTPAGSLPPPPPPSALSAAASGEDTTSAARPGTAPPPKRMKSVFRLPPTELLQEPQARPPYDTQELKEIAARIKTKFEEFNVHGLRGTDQSRSGRHDV